jgi:Putative adhesin
MPTRGWHAAVWVSAAIVTLVVLAMGAAWLATVQSKTTKYSVAAPLTRVELALSSGDALIVGTQSTTLEVRRTDKYAFGHAASQQRSLTGGVLRISSRCPKIVVGSCSASYELSVPETVTVNVHTTRGNVRLEGFRGGATVQTTAGNVNVDAYCGFDLAASTGSGDVRIAAACSPARLQVRTSSGNAVALVPPGRYRITAASGAGQPHVNGVIRDPRAPFTIDMRSRTGSVAIGGGL